MPKTFLDFLRDFFSVRQITSLIVGSMLIAGAIWVIGWVFALFPLVRSQWSFWIFVPGCIIVIALALELLRRTTLPRPRFRVAFGQLSLGPDPNDPQNSSAVVVTLNMYNTGLPSIVDHWQFKMTPVGELSKVGEPVTVFGPVTLRAANGESTQYLENDSLLIRGVQAPIATGGMIFGYIVFHIRGVAPEVAIRANTLLELTCIDALGNEHSFPLAGC